MKLIPTKEQIRLLEYSSHEYIKVINTLEEMVKAKKSTKKSTKDIEANIPSAVKNQAIKDAKSLFATKVKKSNYKIIPILKRPVCTMEQSKLCYGIFNRLGKWQGQYIKFKRMRLVQHCT